MKYFKKSVLTMDIRSWSFYLGLASLYISLYNKNNVQE